jgi:hypothetical protein
MERAVVDCDYIPEGSNHPEVQRLRNVGTGRVLGNAVSPFYWINLVMKEVGEKVRRMLNEEVTWCRMWKDKMDKTRRQPSKGVEDVPLVVTCGHDRKDGCSI